MMTGESWAALWQEPLLISSGVEGSMITTTIEPKSDPMVVPNTTVVWFSNPQSKRARVNGTVYSSTTQGQLGSWKEAGSVPGVNWKAGPGRPQNTSNFGYNMMVSLSDGVPRQQTLVR